MNNDSIIGQLAEVGDKIRTQDNQCTADPIFLVQSKRRIYGMDSDYCNDYEWLSEYDSESVASEKEAETFDDLEIEGKEVVGWEKLYYIDIWEFVTCCFTEAAAKDYIERNKHRHWEMRIYVDSLYRNPEMKLVREFLKGLIRV